MFAFASKRTTKWACKTRLRGILNAGGDIRQDWDIEKAFELGDKTVGVPVLTTLYSKMKNDPMPVDLPAMWKQLGIEPDGRTVHLERRRAPRRDSPRAYKPRLRKTCPSSPALTPPFTSAIYAGRTRSHSRKTVSS